MSEIALLDCTLRDGGYINDWKWGERTAKDIISLLCKSNVDVIEVGFLRNIDVFSPSQTIGNYIEELETFLPKVRPQNTIFSAMAMQSNYDISKLSEKRTGGIDMIRITFHDYDIKEGFEFAEKVKEKGYLLSINPINIMGYTDKELIDIVRNVNLVHPYQFSIVDTFGSMKRRDLDRIVSIVENNLLKDIRIGLHLHENMALSFSLAQRFIDMNLKRNITIDGSLDGMGRIPGNLPIELIADYVNEYKNEKYDINYLLDAIECHVAPIKSRTGWGYNPSYFLSAKYNLHRNYAEYLINKGELTNRDINCILSRISENKKAVFDAEYAERLYVDYITNEIDDKTAREQIKSLVHGKKIVIIAPGASINTIEKELDEVINNEDNFVIGLNFTYDEKIKCVFFGNSKRINGITNKGDAKFITTSNIKNDFSDYVVNYNTLVDTNMTYCNSLLLLLKLLLQLGERQVTIYGADGYGNKQEYYDNNLKSQKIHSELYNKQIASLLKKYNLNIKFATKSEYEKYIK